MYVFMCFVHGRFPSFFLYVSGPGNGKEVHVTVNLHTTRNTQIKCPIGISCSHFLSGYSSCHSLPAPLIYLNNNELLHTKLEVPIYFWILNESIEWSKQFKWRFGCAFFLLLHFFILTIFRSVLLCSVCVVLWVRNVYASFPSSGIDQCVHTAVYADYHIWPLGPIIKNLNVSIDRHNNMAHMNETAEMGK